MVYLLRAPRRLGRGGRTQWAIEVYRASSIHEAHLVAGLMRQTGLSVTIRNEHTAGLAGELPSHTVYPALWVEGESNLARARDIVDQYEKRLRRKH
jgi:hypothetical protein